MPANVLPSAEEVAALVPTPGSIVWRRSGDARQFFAAGYALVLQVSHPTVGAGVKEHSDYARDPWGRLLRTLDYVNLTVYGGPELAAETGRRVREMHKRIKGRKPDGSHYHALEPDAYAWVHATLAEAIVTANQRFARPMRRDQVERFWREWRRLGRLVGVRIEDLPEDWSGFRVYFDAMVNERLEATDAARDVLATFGSALRPPIPYLSDSAWRALRLPAGRLFTLATVGLLPAPLRVRLGIGWGRAQDLELRTLGRTSRALTPLMPRSLLIMGPGYLRWRREAIERGDVARLEVAPVRAA